MGAIAKNTLPATYRNGQSGTGDCAVSLSISDFLVTARLAYYVRPANLYEILPFLESSDDTYND